MSENNKRKIKNSLMVVSLAGMIAFLIRKLVDIYIGYNPVIFSENLEIITLAVAIISALSVLTYAFALKRKYSLVFAALVFGGGIMEYSDNLFVVNKEININLYGLFLIVIIIALFMLYLENTGRNIRNGEFLILFFACIAVVVGDLIALKVGILEPFMFSADFVPYFETVILVSIPIFSLIYYNAKETSQNVFNSFFVIGAIFYALSQTYYSLFYYRIYAPYFLTGQVFEFFAYSLPILSVLVALMSSIADKDRVINKSEILKKNLFMFFKSAEYNDLITVFVNDRYEIVYSNPKYRNYFNNSGKELQVDFREYLMEKSRRIIERKNYSSSIQIEMEGKMRILELDVVYIPSEDENIFCINAKDVTSYRTMQESLAKSENKYRSFFNLIPDYIFVYDIENNRILEANDAIYEEFDEVKRRNLGDDITKTLFENQGNFKLNQLAKSLYADDIIKMDTYKIIGDNDKAIYVEPNFRLIKVDGKAKQILVFLRNVTNSKKLEELRVENENTMRKLYQAQEHEKVKNEFFANISHELRTPINVIFSALEVMEMYRGEAHKEDEYKSIIKQNSYRLLKLVNNILDSARVDADFYKIRMQNLDVVRIVEDITTSVVPYAANKGIDLIFDTEFEEHVVAFDKDNLERIMLNLLSNAIKFTPPGGGITVNVKRDEDTGMILVSVEDTGIGVPEDKLRTIFDRFVQVNKSTTRDHEGTGIGLSIVDKLANIMGGRCHVESILDKGSTFTIALPDMILEHSEDITENYEISSERVAIELSDI